MSTLRKRSGDKKKISRTEYLRQDARYKLKKFLGRQGKPSRFERQQKRKGKMPDLEGGAFFEKGDGGRMKAKIGPRHVDRMAEFDVLENAVENLDFDTDGRVKFNVPERNRKLARVRYVKQLVEERDAARRGEDPADAGVFFSFSKFFNNPDDLSKGLVIAFAGVFVIVMVRYLFYPIFSI